MKPCIRLVQKTFICTSSLAHYSYFSPLHSCFKIIVCKLSRSFENPPPHTHIPGSDGVSLTGVEVQPAFMDTDTIPRLTDGESSMLS